MIKLILKIHFIRNIFLNHLCKKYSDEIYKSLIYLSNQTSAKSAREIEQDLFSLYQWPYMFTKRIFGLLLYKKYIDIIPV